MFEDVTILIWDFDGTLYKQIPTLKEDVRDAEYRVIADHTHWDSERVLEEFKKFYKTTLSSATQVVAKLSGISVVDAATHMESYYDRTKYIRRDPKLIQLFKNFSRYSHYLFVNGIRSKVTQALNVLGLSETLFVEIVTSEIVGTTKPGPEGFLYILEKTRLPAGEHLMIGDRVDVDLVPAKKLGMKTCLVWSDTTHPDVDVSLPTVYDIENLLR